MTCHQCNSMFEGNFCPHCGTPAVGRRADASSPTTSASPSSDLSSPDVDENRRLRTWSTVSETDFPDPPKKRTGCLIAVIVAVVVSIAMIIAGVISFRVVYNSILKSTESYYDDSYDYYTNRPSITIDMLPVNYQFDLQYFDDDIPTFASASFVNNSDYAVTYYSILFINKATGEEDHFYWYGEDIEPGETSKTILFYGQGMTSIYDMQFISSTFQVRTSYGTFSLYYDYETNEHSY